MCDDMTKDASTDISPGDSNNPCSPHVTQTLRFTLSPPSLHQHTRVPTLSTICVKVPELTRSPPEPTAWTSTPPQHFFILPVQRMERISVHDPQAQFQLFRMCVCGPNDPDNTWEPHLLNEPRPNVKNPQQFIKLFAPTLLANTWAFLKSSWMSQGHTESYFMSSSSAFIVEGYYQHVDILCSELGLHSVGDVERLLFEMVEHLKSLLPPHEQLAYSQQSFASKHPSLEQCRLSLDDMELLSLYVDLDPLDAPRTFLTFDKDGNDLWVCHYHNRRSDPKRRQHHVKHTIKNFGKQDYSARTIKVNLLSPRDIAAVYRIDRVKAGLVAELTVILPWRLSPSEFGQLADCATYLGLTTLCMTERTSNDSDSSNLALQQNALKKESTAYVKSLLRPIVDVGLERISFDWESSLDMCALYQDIRGSRCKVLHLEVKTGDQEVSSVVINSDIGVRHLKCDAELFVAELGGTYLAKRAKSIELLSRGGSCELVWEAIPMAIQGSSVLRMLTLDCKARGHDFKRMVRTIEEIVKPFDNGRIARLPLRDLVIIERTDNDATALFDLTQPISEDYNYLLPISLDVTSRFPPVASSEPSTAASSGGSMLLNQSVSSLLKAYGSVGRVLHLIASTPSCPSLMADLLDSSTDPENLVSLTLRLDHLKESHVDDLFYIMSSSKNTFKQLALVGRPQNYWGGEDATKLLNALEALDETVKDIHVLVTRILSDGIEDWITSVNMAINKTTSTLIVVDTAEELRILVPGITKKGFANLEAIFAGNDSVKEERLIVDIGDPKIY